MCKMSLQSLFESFIHMNKADREHLPNLSEPPEM